MTSIENQHNNHATQPKNRHKGWIIAIFIVGGLVFLCALVGSILFAIGWVDTFRPKTSAHYFHNASIAHMYDVCESKLYAEWDPWMQAKPGSATVIAIYYSQTTPVPDGFYAYDLFIQLDPELVAKGVKLTFPGEGIQAFLLETRAPFITCSPDMKGTINILSESPASMTAKLDVTGVINKNSWAYNGELEFKEGPLPNLK